MGVASLVIGPYYLHTGTNSGKLKVDSMGGRGRNWPWPENLLYLKNKFLNCADFLNADSDAIIIFG